MRFVVDGPAIEVTCPHGKTVRWEGVAAAEKWMGRTKQIFVKCDCAVEEDDRYAPVSEAEVRDLHERAMASPPLARCFAIVSENRHHA